MTGLREVRISKGLRQKDIALMLGCSDVHYGRVERGERKLKPQQVERLARILGKEQVIEMVMGEQDKARKKQ